MLSVVSYTRALDSVSAFFKTNQMKTEYLNADRCLSRICAEDIECLEDSPLFNRSTVDGYAVYSRDTTGASNAVPSVLYCVGETKMGEINSQVLARGECMYVPTGGMLPENADAVAMIEDTERQKEEVFIGKPLRMFENTVKKGEDGAKGEDLLHIGAVINPCKAGLLASIGRTKISVIQKPTFYLISTGDELVAPDIDCPLGKVRDSNESILCAEIASFGTVVGSERVMDDWAQLHKAVQNGLNVADNVVMSGGSSVGIADLTEKLFLSFGQMLIRGVAMKPGKPTLAAVKGNQLLIGLPGHPMAAYASFVLLFKRGFLRAAGCKTESIVYAEAAVNFAGGQGRTCLMPVKVKEENGKLRAYPLNYKSGFLSVMAQADGFSLLADYEEGVDRGQLLKIYTV